MGDKKITVKENYRSYRSFEARKPRERNFCPRCESLDITKRTRKRDYICGYCGWTGISVKKKMVGKG